MEATKNELFESRDSSKIAHSVMNIQSVFSFMTKKGDVGLVFDAIIKVLFTLALFTHGVFAADVMYVNIPSSRHGLV